MNIKNKIIKWLGGYTEEDIPHTMNKSEVIINYSYAKKQLFPISVEFSVNAQHGKPDSDTLEAIKHKLCNQAADFMFKYNLLYYYFYYDEITNCYVMRAKAYVREP